MGCLQLVTLRDDNYYHVSPILYISKVFWKNNISFPQIGTRAFACQTLKNVGFS